MVPRLFEAGVANSEGLSRTSGRVLKICSFGIPFKYYQKVAITSSNSKERNR